MIIVHVDDMLLATNNSPHISRLLSKYDIKDTMRDDDDGGVLLWKASPHCAGRYETWGPGFVVRLDGVCENSLRT